MTNEKRLIDANGPRTQFDDIPPYIGLTGGLVQEYIDQAPTVDFIEVVHGRCEYCKDGKSFIGARMLLGNDGKWHDINNCPNCGRDLRSAQEEKSSSALTLKEFLNLSPEDSQKVYIHYLEIPEDTLYPLCKNYGKVWEARWKGGENDGCKD